MKFDQKTIVTLLIGIVIGGVVMGLIDANRPKPLFSSADKGTYNYCPNGWMNIYNSTTTVFPEPVSVCQNWNTGELGMFGSSGQMPVLPLD